MSRMSGRSFLKSSIFLDFPQKSLHFFESLGLAKNYSGFILYFFKIKFLSFNIVKSIGYDGLMVEIEG